MKEATIKEDVSSNLGKEEVKKDGFVDEVPKKDKVASVKGMEEFVLSEKDEQKFLEKVEAEYTFSTRGLSDWIDTNLKRLKLYNNQKRNAELVGEPLLFTHMNTWLSSLYDDEFTKAWVAREDGDIKTAENLTDVSEYDAELMGKDEIDLAMGWDALFFSYSIVDMIEFDVNNKCPAPSIIDPTSFYYDTLSSSIDGNSIARQGMRFLGWDKYLSEREIKGSSFMSSKALKMLKDTSTNENVEKEEARRQRMEAMGGDVAHFDNNTMGDNNVFQVLEWRTWWKGYKVLALLTPDRKGFLGGKILPRDEKNNSISWFVGSKRFNPQPHQFKGVSLPDILEDKQRAKAILLNDTLNLTRSTVYGSYTFDTNRIKNTADLAWGYDKWVGVDGDTRGAITPIQKDSPNLALLDNMLNYLDVSAQTASATPSLQQGVLSEQQRTLGELQMVAESSKTRYSLALKTFAMADKDFWQLWYLSYKVFYQDGLGDKVVRINGSDNSFRRLNRDDIVCKVDPDIKITSEALSEATKAREFVNYTKVLEYIMQDPDADKRYGLKHALYLASIEQDIIDSIMPPTSDEVIALEQNEMIAENILPPFLENDNHRVHLRIHKEAVENETKRTHRRLHLQALKMIQENPALAPEQPQQGMVEGQESPMAGSPMGNMGGGEVNLSAMM